MKVKKTKKAIKKTNETLKKIHKNPLFNISDVKSKNF